MWCMIGGTKHAYRADGLMVGVAGTHMLRCCLVQLWDMPHRDVLMYERYATRKKTHTLCCTLGVGRLFDDLDTMSVCCNVFSRAHAACAVFSLHSSRCHVTATFDERFSSILVCAAMVVRLYQCCLCVNGVSMQVPCKWLIRMIITSLCA